MATKTTITLSPIKRCHASTMSRKRRLSSLLINNRKHQLDLSLTIPIIHSLPTKITASCEKQMMPSMKLPDLVNDIMIEQQQQREVIVNIATMLRKIGDQIDEQLQINNTSSSIDHRFGQRTITLIYRLSRILRCFL
ncbi:unnamed protein product [Rotaria socialis]|uniref:Uncharacterized protein n=1 Tax=Rotaria socialis TaxID=392032 RepID=A0A820J8L2_9BILA|nr:unnamed protein product [Rotaria socialis]CAF3465405.1 unnamed protein product [Rotaria socialis]CAF3680481.1 unnamed protein product [Rotaria socialis]CAF4323104.1 unnamed protein product [Rotaria socialis]CAF4469215.1 unnamed protein product [Rotaria socialis]